MFTLQVRSGFDAAHSLPEYPGNCANVHGHRWDVEVQYQGDTLDTIGMCGDFKCIKRSLNQLLDRFDHQLINQLIDQPTAENIAKWLYDHLPASIGHALLKSVRVWEGRDTDVTYIPGIQ